MEAAFYHLFIPFAVVATRFREVIQAVNTCMFASRRKAKTWARRLKTSTLGITGIRVQAVYRDGDGSYGTLGIAFHEVPRVALIIVQESTIEMRSRAKETLVRFQQRVPLPSQTCY